MAVIISSTNNKWWVGKTTTVVNISTMLAKDYGKKVLVVDLDQQCNLSQAILGKYNFDWSLKNAWELFNWVSPYSVQELIVKSSFGVDIIPWRVDDLFLLEKELDVIYDKIWNKYISNLERGEVTPVLSSMKEDVSLRSDWVKILRKRISEVANDYDYIFYDLPPSVSRVPKNAWVSSDFLLIPISDYFALNWTEGLIARMVDIKREYNENLKFIFLFNKVPMTSNMWRKDAINKEYNKIIESFTQAINENDFLSSMSYIMNTKIRYSPDIEKIYGMNTILNNVEWPKIIDDYKQLVWEFTKVVN